MAKGAYIGYESTLFVNMLPSIDGITGFSGSGISASTAHTKYAANSLLMTGTTSTTEIAAQSSASYTLDPTHLYYARVEIYQETVQGSSDFYWVIAEPNFFNGKTVSAANTWTLISAINNRSSFTAGDYPFRLDYNNNSVAGKMWFDGVMLIDLTAACGAGNEPSVEWCDANIPYFVGSAFIETPVLMSKGRKVKKGYIGTTRLTNILPSVNSTDWSLSNVSIVQDSPLGSMNTFQFQTGTTAMATYGLPTPIAGHLYYGRCLFYTESGFTAGDGRFEYYYTDATNGTMAFHNAAGDTTDGAVQLRSSIMSVSEDISSGANWTLRNFVANGSSVCYRTEPMIIDLTAACGAGNEPTKEWCDANIPYFIGSKDVPLPNVQGIARKIKKGYIGVTKEFPIYETTIETRTVQETITGANISQYFTVSNGSSYYFNDANNTGTFTSNNGGVNNSSATTTLTALIDINDLTFDYSYSSESGCDLYTIIVAGVTVLRNGSGTTTSKSYSGSVTAGQQLSFTYTKDGSVNANDDKCTFSNMKFSVQKEVEVQVQVGTEIKDVACLFFANSLQYYGQITDLSSNRMEAEAKSVGDYILVAGGYDGSAHLSTVDVYDKDLVKTTATDLSDAKDRFASVSNGNYAIFAAGRNVSKTTRILGSVDTYNKSLIKGTLTEIATHVSYPNAALAGDNILIGGGTESAGTGCIGMNAYNSNLVKVTVDNLTTELKYPAAESVGDYALFIVRSGDAYSKSLVKTTIPMSTVSNIPTYGFNRYAGHTSKYAIFAGANGCSGNNSSSDLVIAIDSNLMIQTIDPLSVSRFTMAVTSIEDNVIIAGGYSVGSGRLGVVDIYDSNLVHTIGQTLAVNREYATAASNGKFALICGGKTSSAVEAFTI